MPEENNHSRNALKRLGVDPDNLGCVMLDVNVSSIYRDALDPSRAYYSNKYQYVKGYEGESHITLLYGLLLSAQKNRDLIDGVLDGWNPPAVVTMYDIDVFYGDDGDNKYGVLVHKMGLNHWDMDILEDGNNRLAKLPHVRGFPSYNPHVTIGYVELDYVNEASDILTNLYVTPMIVKGLNYGG